MHFGSEKQLHENVTLCMNSKRLQRRLGRPTDVQETAQDDSSTWD